jgi:hypothetical protein
MNYLIRVKANHNCWIASCDGDPGRTLLKENATHFPTQFIADKRKNTLQGKYPERKFIVEPITQ